MPIINFHLSSESFANNGIVIDEVYKKIDELNDIKIKIDEINKRKKDINFMGGIDCNDIIFKNMELYEQFIVEGLKVQDFMYGIDKIDPNYRTLLRVIVDKSTFLDEEEIHKYIGFNHIGDDLIYTDQKLINYYYEHMKNILDTHVFFERIKLHFSELKFRDEVHETLNDLETGLEGFAGHIIKALIYLEKDFKRLFNETGHLDTALNRLSGLMGFKITLEGKGKHKFDFNFIKDDGSVKTICCEPHVKMKYSEIGDKSKIHNRIYFHLGDPEIANGKVLIGYIGCHP